MLINNFRPYAQLANAFPDHLDDYGQANLLIEFVGENICNIDGLGWCAFNGTLWEPSPNCVERAALALTDYQAEAANHLDSSALQALTVKYFDKITLRDIVSFIKKYRSASGVANVTKIFKAQLKPCKFEDFDSDPYILCTPCGVYDLTQGMHGLRQAKASDKIMLCTAVAPSNAGMDLWLDALTTATNGDQSLIDFIQLRAGLGLIGEVKDQRAVLIQGTSGSAKSTLWNPMTQVLGTYSINLHADVLLSDKISDNVAMIERASLRKKRWALCSEMDEGVLSESSLKKIVSTDTIKGRFLYQSSFQFEPTHSLFCYLNRLPVLESNTPAVRNRLLIIPFNSVVDENKKIYNYGKVLFEKAGPAILAWMIEGAKKVIELNFKTDDQMPEIVKNCMHSYFDGQDWLSEFLNSVCIFGDDCVANSGQLYDLYISYTRCKNKKAVSTSTFADLMKARYAYESKRSTENGQRVQKSVFKGLAINYSDAQVQRYLNK